MYDEDRQTALTMYERMFDETADEQGLLQLLVSPTRQAVVLARSYDAKERKLQIESRSRDDNYTPDPEDVPSFVFIIDKTAKQAAELGVKDIEVSEDQFSIFDELMEAAEEEPVAEAEAVPAPVIAEEEPVAEEPAPEAEAVDAEEEVQSEELSDVEETANAVDAFLADFSVENGELISNKAENEEPVEEAEEEAAEELAEEIEPVAEAEVEAEAEAAPVYRTKTNVFLLILYIFFAIPLGLVGVAVLLVPTALLLALAVSFIGTGVSAVAMSFGSFAVIADLMVVLGAGLIISALGLLFAWLFIWFIIRVIFGFIRSVCRLGRKICCKEVAVQ